MKHVVVLTGAGISAESGLKTFRDSDGLWEGYNVYDVATPEAWARNPQLVQDFYNQRRKTVIEAQPNAAHRALRDLEKKYRTTIISQFKNNTLAIFMPLAAMAISDLFIGNGFSLIVYTGFIAIVICGMLIRNKVTLTNVGLSSIAGALLFYLITNFAFFYPTTMYSRDFAGIMQSYINGLPFLRNALIADLIYVPALFGTFYFLEKRYPALAQK